jgi:hypothetical protein
MTRRILFWTHLSLGVAAGAVLGVGSKAARALFADIERWHGALLDAVMRFA